MTTCHLLFLEAGRLSAFVRQRGKLETAGVFSANAAGNEQFANYLAERRQGRFYLLTNLADEAYASESIPPLSGGDRRTLIARKARQHFPEPALNCVYSLGREKTGRRNENLLISALTAPEQLQPWLQLIKDAQAALIGIYSTAQLGGPLLGKVGQAAPHCLLLCQFGHSLRESYLNEGCTVFSRLIAIGDTSAPAIANDFVTEASRLHQYLIGQRRIGREARLPIFILAHPQAVAEIEKSCAAAGNLDFRIIDKHLAARRLKLEAQPEDSCCTSLFLQLLANQQPREQFAGPALRLDYRLAQSRRLLGYLGFGMLSLSGLSTAHTLHQAQALREASWQMGHDQQLLQQRYQAIVGGFPKLDLDPGSVRQLIERHDELAAQRNQLAPGLFMLGSILDQVSEIELDNLDWRVENIAPGAQASVVQEAITLNGHLPGENAGAARRQALASLEHFNKLLRSTSNCTAEIAKPLLTTPSPGNDENALEEAESLVTQHFSLRITCPK